MSEKLNLCERSRSIFSMYTHPLNVIHCLLTTLSCVYCLFAVPEFFSSSTIRVSIPDRNTTTERITSDVSYGRYDHNNNLTPRLCIHSLFQILHILHILRQNNSLLTAEECS